MKDWNRTARARIPPDVPKELHMMTAAAESKCAAMAVPQV